MSENNWTPGGSEHPVGKKSEQSVHLWVHSRLQYSGYFTNQLIHQQSIACVCSDRNRLKSSLYKWINEPFLQFSFWLLCDWLISYKLLEKSDMCINCSTSTPLCAKQLAYKYVPVYIWKLTLTNLITCFHFQYTQVLKKICARSQSLKQIKTIKNGNCFRHWRIYQQHQQEIFAISFFLFWFQNHDILCDCTKRKSSLK